MIYHPELKTLKIRLMAALIVVVMFIATGAAIFQRIERAQDISYVDALYFSTMTALTIGFGDIVPKTNLGKIFVIFYSLIGVALAMYILFGLGRYMVRSQIGRFRRTETEKIEEEKNRYNIIP